MNNFTKKRKITKITGPRGCGKTTTLIEEILDVVSKKDVFIFVGTQHRVQRDLIKERLVKKIKGQLTHNYHDQLILKNGTRIILAHNTEAKFSAWLCGQPVGSRSYHFYDEVEPNEESDLVEHVFYTETLKDKNGLELV